MKLLVLVTTVGREEDAERIAAAAVERRLAACVHIDTIRSLYRWQGEVQRDTEHRLMFKTTDAAAPALQALILEMHPYELPALYSLPVVEATDAYRHWVVQEAGG